MAYLTDIIDPFNGELSSFGYRLGNMYAFEVDRNLLNKLLAESEGDTIHLGFDALIPDLTLRELSPDKVRLAIRLATKMFIASDYSVIELNQLKRIYRDIEKIEEKLNDKRWMDQ